MPRELTSHETAIIAGIAGVVGFAAGAVRRRKRLMLLSLAAAIIGLGIAALWTAAMI